MMDILLYGVQLRRRSLMEIKTPSAVIKATAATDPEYPGIFIDIDDKQAVLVEFDSSRNKHVVRVWNHEEEDYIFIQQY